MVSPLVGWSVIIYYKGRKLQFHAPIGAPFSFAFISTSMRANFFYFFVVSFYVYACMRAKNEPIKVMHLQGLNHFLREMIKQVLRR